MNDKKFNIGKSDIVLTVVSALFFIGTLSFIAPCGPKDDGSWMSCHWAGQALKGVAFVLLVISVIHMFASDIKIKQGLDFSMIPTAILAAVLPGFMINLCMMNTMRCHSVTRIGAIIFAAALIIIAVFDSVLQNNRTKHRAA